MTLPIQHPYSIEIPHTDTTTTTTTTTTTDATTTTHSRSSNIRRHANPLSSPTLAYDGCFTLYETLRRGKALNPLGPCLGYRATSTTGHATPYVYASYTEVVARVDAFAAGLDRLGLLKTAKKDGDSGMTLLGIYMKNCAEWIIAEHGVYTLGGATVPFYDTLGPTTVQFILNHTSCPAVVSTRAELSRLCEAKRSGQCPAFSCVILVDGVVPEAAQLAQSADLHVVSFAKVEAMGAQIVSTEGRHCHHPPSGNDVATFCYTSGTTGNPKGALITHTNFVSGMRAAHGNGLTTEIYDRHISYLPLPHIFERVVLNGILANGAAVGFFRGDPTLLIEDFVALRPTILIAAPRVLNKIHDKIKAGISAAGGMKKNLFDKALATKSDNLRNSGRLTHALYDRLIFHKIKAALGMDHLRFLVSGSAPLSDAVMTFFRCLLSVPVVEGYGQTEGTAAATLGSPDDQASIGHVGGPLDGLEVVLFDVPDMGYLGTDTEHNGQPCRGRGEVCIRGPTVFRGYYKDEEKTNETIDNEGWLHSGDIGLWTPAGQLKIIDRKKNIFKLSQGEYVAAEKIENVLIGSPLIAQAFVYGDSYQSCLVAIVVPDEDVVRKWATDAADSETLSKQSFASLCSGPRLRLEIISQIKALAKEAGLHGFETPKAVHLEAEQFTAENGLVTPTFKLKRHQLKEYYKEKIGELYGSLRPAPSKL